MIQPIPSDPRAPEAPAEEVTLEAPTYDLLREKLDAELPEGYRVLWVRTA
ncbi:hypothetical protein ACFWGN_20945 [Oerskovia sp. NPDC060338]